MMSLRSFRCMEGKKLAHSKQVRRTGVKYSVFLQCRGQAGPIEIVDSHAEAPRTLSNSLTYPSHTENAENLSGQLPPQQHLTRQCPFSCTHHFLAFVRPP